MILLTDILIIIEVLLLFSLPIILIVGILYLSNKKKNNNPNIQQNQNVNQSFEQTKIEQPIQQQPEQTTIIQQKPQYPYYLVSSLLSAKEQSFYRALKPIADELGLIVFSKMRIVDIVNVPQNHPEYMKWFNYIKAKHIDFIICDQNFKLYKLIEVDDYTHRYQKRQERDEFVNEIFRQLNVDLLRYYQWTPQQLREDLCPAPVPAATPEQTSKE